MSSTTPSMSSQNASNQTAFPSNEELDLAATESSACSARGRFASYQAWLNTTPTADHDTESTANAANSWHEDY